MGRIVINHTHEDIHFAICDRIHPTTAFVLRVMGGWATACLWTESALDFKRRDFINHWTECHGNVDAMALGAVGLLPAIEARNHALHVGTGISGLLEGATK